MTKEEIEKLPNIIDMLLSESVLVDTKEKTHEKITEVCNLAIQALEQEPREITLEDVKEYCKPRCLTIITNELLYELTHPKNGLGVLVCITKAESENKK